MSLIPPAPRDWAGGLERWFLEPVDGRVYALVRIAYALASLCVLVVLWPIRDVLLGADGMIAPLPLYNGPPVNLVHVAARTGFLDAYVALSALACVTLALGLLTRLSAFLVFVWNASFAAALYPATNGADAVLRSVGFALLIAPPCTAWALDARLFTPRPNAPRYALRLIQWQMMVLYLTTVWLKAPDPYWRDGTVMSYFWMSMFARAPSAAYANWPLVSALFSWGTIVIEASVPFLCWIKRTRWLGLLAGFVLHAGIAATTDLGLFSLSMVPLYLAFLDGDDLARREP